MFKEKRTEHRNPYTSAFMAMQRKRSKKETVKGVDSKRLGVIVTWLKDTRFQAEGVVPNVDQKVYTIGNMEDIRNPCQGCFARDTGADGRV